MKTTFLYASLLAGLSTFVLGAAPTLAASTSDISSTTETCHALKFDSYFVAGNVKDNIKSVNKDLTHPNFAKHFLLLRAELAMENLYLIANCATGEFFHEKLSYDFATFTKDSNQLEVKTKQGEVTQFEWDGTSWVRGETQTAEAVANNAAAATLPSSKPVPAGSNSTGAGIMTTFPAPAKSPRTKLTEQYKTLFAKYPVTETTPTCAPLDYSSYFRAQNNKDAIPKLNTDLNKPNFAGTKSLLRTETMFEKIYLLADCKTGKFSDEFLKGEIDFHPDSRLVVIKSSSDLPQLMIWSDGQWIKIPDPIQKGKGSVKNTLYGAKAALLVKNLPNPHHLDNIQFEALKRTDALSSLFQELGSDTITSGRCRFPQGKSPECDVEVE